MHDTIEDVASRPVTQLAAHVTHAIVLLRMLKKKQPIHDIMRITDGWIISDAVEIKLICASSSFSRWHRLVTTVLRWMLNHRFRIAAVNLFEQLAAVAQIDTQIGQ